MTLTPWAEIIFVVVLFCKGMTMGLKKNVPLCVI